MKFNNRRFYSRLNIFLFSGLLIVLGVRFFFGEHKKFSEDEKRDLAVMPSFTWNTFFDGKYIDSIDDYIADHFPYRDEFLKTSFTMRDSRGIKDNGISYYRKPVVRKEPQNKVDVKKSMTADTAAAADTTAEEPDGAEEEDNLLLYNGHAMEIFGGNDKMAKAYADVINSYQDALKGKVKIYDVVVPSSIEFNCPPGYKTNEKRNIGAIYNNLAPGVTGVDAYSAIAPHRNEYIYFRTDHHWTGLGAYYAYTATARDMGFTPLELDQLDKRYIPNFLGSL
ncbi:MAG TPA: DHHW family protein, partial [Bacteroidia bacterium]|nr:DHHW family protein [Bacteroidia bacterium]